MKNIKSIYALVIAVIFTASCSNDLPEFDDKDAFVSFTMTTMSVGEEKDTLDVPVLLTSLAGLSSTVNFSLGENSTAVEGVHFRIKNASNTLTFTKEEPTQYIQLEIIDNTTFDGDVTLSFVLSNPQGVNLGAAKTCNVTIEDDEHPLLIILGSFTAKGESAFNGTEEWNVTIEKDPEDLSKVWISNFVNGGSNKKVYGKVNADKTEILIPVKQEILESASYPHILLDGFSDEEGEVEIPVGGNIVGTIAEDGAITIQDWFGSQVYTDEAATESAGWYNVYLRGVVLKK